MYNVVGKSHHLFDERVGKLRETETRKESEIGLGVLVQWLYELDDSALVSPSKLIWTIRFALIIAKFAIMSLY